MEISKFLELRRKRKLQRKKELEEKKKDPNTWMCCGQFNEKGCRCRFAAILKIKGFCPFSFFGDKIITIEENRNFF
jgi:hypothetical protein